MRKSSATLIVAVLWALLYGAQVSCAIETVPIGVIFPLEGAQETLGPLVDMAEEDINDYMERHNYSYRFEFLIENAEGQVDVHLEKVQEFKSMGIDLIIGGALSSQAQGSLSYVNQNDMLLLSHGSNNPALGIPDDNLFRLCPTVIFQTRAIAEMLRSYGIEACVVIQRADDVVDDIYTALKEDYEDLGGTMLGRIRYDVGTTDFSDYLQSAENIAAQAVEEHGQQGVAVEVLGLDEVARMAAQASDFSTLYGCKWFGYVGTALASRILSDAPEEADHLKIFSPIMAPPDNQQYQSLYDRYSSVMDRGPNFFEAAFYDACWLYALTVAEADSADAMDVKAQLPLLASRYGGASGEWDLNEDGDRERASYNILGCVLEDGVAERVKYGYYDAKTGQVVWEVALNREPTADADGPYSGVVGDPVSFSSTGSSDPDGTIQEYRWHFGDGSAPSYSQDPMYVYSAAGTYTVTLRVTDDDGASATYTTSCTVSEPEATGTAWSIERIATLITIGGATVGVVGWMLRTRSERRRRAILYKEHMQGADSIYTRYKMNARQCEAELYRFKEQVMSEFKQGMITEENYNVLDGRIEEFLAEIREEILRERPEDLS